MGVLYTVIKMLGKKRRILLWQSLSPIAIWPVIMHNKDIGNFSADFSNLNIACDKSHRDTSSQFPNINFPKNKT